MTPACAQCGAVYADGTTTCAAHFDALLALDHARTEPWGSRHGLAFAAFVLQHPDSYAATVRAGAWEMLQRVFVLGEDRQYAALAMRAQLAGGAMNVDRRLTPLPNEHTPFTVTIADLRDFEAATYPAALDAWCRAVLKAYAR